MSKSLGSWIIVSVLFLSELPVCRAQNQARPDTEMLRGKIEELEKADLNARSALVRDTYKRTLINLYTELQSALTQDINDLKKIQAIAGSAVNSNGEIANQIQKLEHERGATSEKVKTLQNQMPAAAVENSSTNGSVSLSNGTSTPPAAAAARTSVATDSASTSTSSLTPAALQPAAPAADDASVIAPICDSNNYPDAPELVTNAVSQMAANLVQNNNNLSFLGQNYPQVFLYTIADAIIPGGENTDRSIRQLKAYRYLAETARTDKQTGSSAKSAGTTSAIEKAGFARLLGIAVERGAILQDVSSSSLTLTTSPYVLYTFNHGGDSQQNYERAGFLNRVGMSATFNIGDSNSAVLTNARRSQLSEWSARVRLFGDRSTRSRSFQRFWDAEIEPQIQARLSVIGNNLNVVGNTPELKRLKDEDLKKLRKVLQDRMAKPDFKEAVTAGGQEKQKAILNSFILCYLKQAVFDPVRNGTVPVSPDVRTQIGTNFIRDLGKSLVGLEHARKELNAKLDDLFKGPLATFAYINHRVPTASDYSEFKFLYEQDQSAFRMLKIVGNMGFSIYNKPNPLLNQTRLRDFSASLSLEGKADSPFLRNVPDLSKITYAFTGSYERMRENQGIPGRKADLAAAQFRLEIPVTAGVSLPFAVTYSNGTEQQRGNHTRGNFGLSLDTDKLLAITRLLRLQ